MANYEVFQWGFCERGVNALCSQGGGRGSRFLAPLPSDCTGLGGRRIFCKGRIAFFQIATRLLCSAFFIFWVKFGALKSNKLL